MNDLKNTIANFTKNISKTSGGLIKTTKLSIDLSNEEAALKNLYMDIGKKIHEIYAYGGSMGKFFDEKYKEILSMEEKISSLREQIDVAKGTKTCTKCGKSSARTSEFCPKCGASMKDAIDNTEEPKYPPTDYQEFDMNNGMPGSGMNQGVPEAKPMPVPEAREVSMGVIDLTQDSPQASEPQGKKCNVCGAMSNPNDKFCLHCGRTL